MVKYKKSNAGKRNSNLNPDSRKLLADVKQQKGYYELALEQLIEHYSRCSRKATVTGQKHKELPVLHKRMIYHEIEWYRVRILLSSL